jgi:hypothetical protein
MRTQRDWAAPPGYESVIKAYLADRYAQRAAGDWEKPRNA